VTLPPAWRAAIAVTILTILCAALYAIAHPAIPAHAPTPSPSFTDIQLPTL
jgi:hypothetical protein